MPSTSCWRGTKPALHPAIRVVTMQPQVRRPLTHLCVWPLLPFTYAVGQRHGPHRYASWQNHLARTSEDGIYAPDFCAALAFTASTIAGTVTTEAGYKTALAGVDYLVLAQKQTKQYSGGEPRVLAPFLITVNFACCPRNRASSQYAK